MKKIMFNDKYGLTEAVLTGRKTQTRRLASPRLWYLLSLDTQLYMTEMLKHSRYKIGEVVAIAQSYSSLNLPYEIFGKGKGWANKMFVSAGILPHRIKITNVRFEILQDISDYDCMAEGVIPDVDFDGEPCHSLRENFADLIDKVSGKGTWDRNPFVFVYDFELIN